MASARALGQVIAETDRVLVYGGAKVGLMGALADSVLAAGGKVIGVVPRALVDKEVAHDALTELHVVSSMHERKAMMAELADAFIAMPGGLGTLEEFFRDVDLGTTWSPAETFGAPWYSGFLRTPTSISGRTRVSAVSPARASADGPARAGPGPVAPTS
jgi:uncharacterized protein (TIGR00730 family)